MRTRRANSVRTIFGPFFATALFIALAAWATVALWPRGEKPPSGSVAQARTDTGTGADAPTVPAEKKPTPEIPQPRETPSERLTWLPASGEAGPTPRQELLPVVDGTCDIWDDASVCRFVGPDTPFTDARYEPADLKAVSGPHMETSKPAQLRAAALAALDDMADAHFRDLGRPILVVSGYRSYAYQKGIKDRGCSDALCAKAGHSEHQTGLAVDLFATTTEKEFLAVPEYAASHAWLRAHAHEYGFTESYRNGRDVDGYEKEPWHWRYVGTQLAGELRSAGQTLTQRASSARAGNAVP